jgi:hypothetical protein
MEVAERHQSQLARIKLLVKRAYEYFKPNYDRYNEFRRFVFESSLSNEEITLLMSISRPQLEFNILEAYISRLLGEFSKQEPDIEVHGDDENTADPKIIEVVEQHLRHALTDSKNHHTRYEVYKDILSGGFSALKVTTEYAKPMSFHQVINIERCYDPTLVGFDHLSQYSHKGDGRFCFEIYPRAKEEFEELYPDIDIDDIKYMRGFSGFNWSYLNDNTPTLLECMFYEKIKREKTIVMVKDHGVMTMDKYKEMLNTWGEFTAPPSIVGRPRKTTLETICRYHLIEDKVLAYEETDFTMLPLIFVDGNSVLIKTPKNGNVRQVTRPYVYHAKGAQRLKNFSGISLANEVENTVQHKFMVAKEALPKEEEFLEAYKDVQKANVLVYNSFFEQNPDQQIPNPIREVQKVPAPPEIIQSFSATDQIIQNVLGSYDASIGINNNQLSGMAIVEAASQSNAAAMPYIVGYLQGYQRAAQIYVDLIPKYYTLKRSLPLMDNEGRKGSITINDEENPNSINMFYDSNALNVIVKAGASFQVQKSRTIMMIKEMMGMSQLFAQFIADKGLNFVLDNMDGRGIEKLKAMVSEWQQEMAQQKQMAQQQAMQQTQNNPQLINAQANMAKVQLEGQKSQRDFMVDMNKLKVDQMQIQADIAESQADDHIELVKAATERYSKAVDLKLKHADMNHRHANEAIKTHHMITQSKNQGSNHERA